MRIEKTKETWVVARPGEHNPEYYDETRDCWTDHASRASEWSTKDEAEQMIEFAKLGDDAYAAVSQ